MSVLFTTKPSRKVFPFARPAGAVLTGLLLAGAYPPLEWSFLAWIALVPLLSVISGQRPGRALAWGYLSGLVFFGATFYWFVHVTFIGAAALTAYLSLYFGLFSFLYTLAQRRPLPALNVFLAPALWVALEFIRAHLFTGFGWAALGHSQYRVLPFIQIADLTGVAGVSYLVMMVNVFCSQILRSRGAGGLGRVGAGVAGVLVMVLVYGLVRLAAPISGTGLTVAVVQANIAQDLKWQPPAWPSILAQYEDLTREAADDKPDLIIWPETAFPGYVGDEASEGMFRRLQETVRQTRVPLLLGAITLRGEHYYNSALLVGRDGRVFLQHDKLHLVPFGEYIPLRRVFPFLGDVVPISDFTPGQVMTLFPAELEKRDSGPQKYYSVLICFEDTVAKIARDLTGAGANALINITNDAWFGDTQAPFLHRQDAVFRAVENRRPLVRAANTGVSCFVDPWGRVTGDVRDARGRATFVSGISVGTVGLTSARAWYTKMGDIFTYLCFGCILGWFFYAWYPRR